MALGKPVISTAVGAAAEVITPGTDGELVEPGDAAGLAAALERMTRDAAHRHALGQRARERFESYLTSERYGHDIARVFREALASGERPQPALATSPVWGSTGPTPEMKAMPPAVWALPRPMSSGSL